MVDGIVFSEERFEPREGRKRARIAKPVHETIFTGMDDGEDDRDIELLGRRAGKTRAIEAFVFQPEVVEPAAYMDGGMPAGRGLAVILVPTFSIEPRRGL